MGKVERSLRNAMPVSVGQGQSTLTVRDGHVIKYSINSHLCNVNGACPCACDCVWNVRSWRRRVHIWVFMASVFVLQFLICVFFAELLIVFRTTSRPSFFFFFFFWSLDNNNRYSHACFSFSFVNPLVSARWRGWWFFSFLLERT